MAACSGARPGTGAGGACGAVGNCKFAILRTGRAGGIGTCDETEMTGAGADDEIGGAEVDDEAEAEAAAPRVDDEVTANNDDDEAAGVCIGNDSEVTAVGADRVSNRDATGARGA